MYEYFKLAVETDQANNNGAVSLRTLLKLFEDEELLSRTLIDKDLYTPEYILEWQREKLYIMPFFQKLWAAVVRTAEEEDVIHSKKV